MAGFYCDFIVLCLNFLLHWHFNFKPALLLNQKVIVDFQDFGLTNEARPQTAGRAVAFREKGVAQAHGAGICKALEYAAARVWHILAPLYAVPLPRYYCRKISIQGAALHKVGPQTCAAPCCCIKWRLAYCGAMGLCHPFFQGGNSIVLPPL